MVIGFTVTIVVLVVIIIGLAAALIWNLCKNRKGTGIIDNYTVYSFIMHKLFLNVALTLTLKVAIASLRAARPKKQTANISIMHAQDHYNKHYLKNHSVVYILYSLHNFRQL